MPDVGLLAPGISPDGLDDLAFARAMVEVEVAWMGALARAGVAAEGAAETVARGAASLMGDDGRAVETVSAIAHESAATGNPVLPLLMRLRTAVEAIDPAAASLLHRGLTSQDVVDSALVLLLREAARRTSSSLTEVRRTLAALAARHRSTPVLAYTMGQAALPTTFGARAAGWLQAIAEADERLRSEAGALPVAFGGPVGTLDSVPSSSTMTPIEVVTEWARILDLAVPPGPWHVTRFPILRISGANAEVCTALGKLSADVLTAERSGSGELREPRSSGRGASTAMPFKSNPVLSILLRRSALTAPALLSQLHIAGGLAVDERPDGAWQAEWEPALALARHTASSAELAAEMTRGVEFDPAAAAAWLAANGPDADAGFGEAETMVDRILSRYGDPEGTADD